MEKVEYQSDETKLILFNLVPLLVSIYLIFSGISNLGFFSLEADVASRIFLGYFPVFWGTMIIFLIVALFYHNYKKSIILDKDFLIYRSSSKGFSLRWKELQHETKGMLFHRLVIADRSGSNEGYIDESFSPKFREIISKIEIYRKQARKEEDGIFAKAPAVELERAKYYGFDNRVKS